MKQETSISFQSNTKLCSKEDGCFLANTYAVH